MAATIEVERRFNGPLDSGNGGYSAGLLANLIDGPVEASLRSAVPLDTPLTVVAGDDGALRAFDGERLVVEARPAPDFDLAVPEPVDLDAAHDAATRYRGLPDGPFCRCFVCGLRRDDVLGVFAGDVAGRQLVAAPWTPPAWAADGDGLVRPEIVWAVLDCPTFFAAHVGQELTVSVLARQTAAVARPVRAGEEHVVIAWPIAAEGRKRWAGSAVLSATGEPLAVAEALLIEPRAG
jgi:hypothetical protein